MPKRRWISVCWGVKWSKIFCKSASRPTNDAQGKNGTLQYLLRLERAFFWKGFMGIESAWTSSSLLEDSWALILRVLATTMISSARSNEAWMVYCYVLRYSPVVAVCLQLSWRSRQFSSKRHGNQGRLPPWTYIFHDDWHVPLSLLPQEDRE